MAYMRSLGKQKILCCPPLLRTSKPKTDAQVSNVTLKLEARMPEAHEQTHPTGSEVGAGE